jgi:hypothetical protein
VSPWSAWSLWVSHTNDKANFFVREQGGTAPSVLTDAAIPLNEWVCVVCRLHTDNTLDIVLNGVPQADTASASNILDETPTVHVGAYHAGSNRIHGAIATVALWDRVLSVSECLDIYNRMKP